MVICYLSEAVSLIICTAATYFGCIGHAMIHYTMIVTRFLDELCWEIRQLGRYDTKPSQKQLRSQPKAVHATVKGRRAHRSKKKQRTVQNVVKQVDQRNDKQVYESEVNFAYTVSLVIKYQTITDDVVKLIIVLLQPDSLHFATDQYSDHEDSAVIRFPNQRFIIGRLRFVAAWAAIAGQYPVGFAHWAQPPVKRSPGIITSLIMRSVTLVVLGHTFISTEKKVCGKVSSNITVDKMLETPKIARPKTSVDVKAASFPRNWHKKQRYYEAKRLQEKKEMAWRERMSDLFASRRK
ncbi:hypothetical protein EDC01DRAFT_634109 [Geopyxis carbonaria]|nr:hypothetical protein EDC01DRAFT_634109 [Geopyxis carbonaria]